MTIHHVSVDAIVLSNAKEVYLSGISSLSKEKEVTFNLNKIKNVDTSGIAVLFAWWQYAVDKGVSCRFEVSDPVSDILRAYDIELP